MGKVSRKSILPWIWLIKSPLVFPKTTNLHLEFFTPVDWSITVGSYSGPVTKHPSQKWLHFMSCRLKKRWCWFCGLLTWNVDDYTPSPRCAITYIELNYSIFSLLANQLLTYWINWMDTILTPYFFQARNQVWIIWWFGFSFITY